MKRWSFPESSHLRLPDTLRCSSGIVPVKMFLIISKSRLLSSENSFGRCFQGHRHLLDSNLCLSISTSQGVSTAQYERLMSFASKCKVPNMIPQKTVDPRHPSGRIPSFWKCLFETCRCIHTYKTWVSFQTSRVSVVLNLWVLFFFENHKLGV